MKLKMRGELGMKVHALTIGKDPEEFVKEQTKKIGNTQEKAKKFRFFAMIAVAIYFAYKQFSK